VFYLVLGLVIFLGAHSVRIVAEDWRTRTIARVGPATWKMAYTVVSLLGFALIVWGLGQARMQPVLVWSPPVGMRHAASLLTLLAFVLLAAAYVPGNGIKARVHHPMVLGVKVWALAHLLASGLLAQMLLFAAFLAWAVLDFSAARRRDRAAGTVVPAGRGVATLVTVVAGVVAWLVFAMWLHGWWIGVRPFG
jgi:uncharacterized membrane protein